MLGIIVLILLMGAKAFGSEVQESRPGARPPETCSRGCYVLIVEIPPALAALTMWQAHDEIEYFGPYAKYVCNRAVADIRLPKGGLAYCVKRLEL
jgi:hypothetical protein